MIHDQQNKKNEYCDIHTCKVQRYSALLLTLTILHFSLLACYLLTPYSTAQLISVAARPMAWFCGRLFAGIAGSNPAESMAVSLLQVFVVR